MDAERCAIIIRNAIIIRTVAGMPPRKRTTLTADQQKLFDDVKAMGFKEALVLEAAAMNLDIEAAVLFCEQEESERENVRASHTVNHKACLHAQNAREGSERVKKRQALAARSSVRRGEEAEAIVEAEAIAEAEDMKTGSQHNVKASVLADITDGWRCRSHPHLMRKAYGDGSEANVIRIPIGFWNDDEAEAIVEAEKRQAFGAEQQPPLEGPWGVAIDEETFEETVDEIVQRALRPIYAKLAEQAKELAFFKAAHAKQAKELAFLKAAHAKQGKQKLDAELDREVRSIDAVHAVVIDGSTNYVPTPGASGSRDPLPRASV